MIQDVLAATFGAGDEKKRAKALLDKKFRGVNLRDPKNLRRASAFLQRCGFSSHVIFDLMRRRAEED